MKKFFCFHQQKRGEILWIKRHLVAALARRLANVELTANAPKAASQSASVPKIAKIAKWNLNANVAKIANVVTIANAVKDQTANAKRSIIEIEIRSGFHLVHYKLLHSVQ